METLGSLVDKLSIVNLKLWNVQDWVHKATSKRAIKRQSKEQIAANLEKLKTLNLQRNSLMNEIDTVFSEAVKKGAAPVEAKVKIV